MFPRAQSAFVKRALIERCQSKYVFLVQRTRHHPEIKVVYPPGQPTVHHNKIETSLTPSCVTIYKFKNSRASCPKSPSAADRILIITEHVLQLAISKHGGILKVSFKQFIYYEIYKVDLCDLESGSWGPIYNSKQLLYERYLHTRFDDPSSFPSQDIGVTSKRGQTDR
jgi:hypothetical protein